MLVFSEHVNSHISHGLECLIPPQAPYLLVYLLIMFVILNFVCRRSEDLGYEQ
jgi:hypothetical protein